MTVNNAGILLIWSKTLKKYRWPKFLTDDQNVWLGRVDDHDLFLFLMLIAEYVT